MQKDFLQLLTTLNLSEPYIINTFGAKTVHKGIDYFNRDYVEISDVLTEEDGTIEILSNVSGSSSHIYQTSTQILPAKTLDSKTRQKGRSSVRVESDCSCPVGFQCKHGLASLLAFSHFIMTSEENSQTAGINKLENLKPKSEVDYWLNDLGSIAKPNTPLENLENQEASSFQYLLFYILTPDRDNGNALKLETFKVKELKRGGYGKLVKQDLNYILLGFKYDDFYYNHLDEEVARLLVNNPTSGGGYYYTEKPNKYDLEGDVGQLALKKIIQTGRSYWREYKSENECLKLGNTRIVNIQWQELEGNYQLVSHVEPAVEEIFRINRLYYLDNKTHHLGLLENSTLSTEQIIKLLSAPAIPHAEAEKVSLQLLKIWPNANIPMPIDLGIEELEIKDVIPTPDVLLHSFEVTDYASDTGKRRIHQLSLRFNYKDQIIKPETELSPFINIDGRTRYHIERNIDAEKQSILKLLDLKFVPLYETGNYDTDLELYFSSESLTATIWSWHDFQTQTIPKLEQQGWKFNFDDSFMLNFDEADDWYADLDEGEDEQSHDWFSINLGIELNGEKINLLPTLVELLSTEKSPEQLREKLLQNSSIILPLNSERWIRLPSERLITIFDTLIELYDKKPLDDDGNLLFSKYQAIHLNELLNDPALSWKGADELQQLNDKIRNFKGIQKCTIPKEVQTELRDYQHDGLNWLQFLREYQFNGILADDMGLGKTVQALVNLLFEKQRLQQEKKQQIPSLIVAPTSLMGNWKRETERFTPDLKILVLHGSERNQDFDKISGYDIILTTYQLILRDSEFHKKQQYHYIILDESQNIKNAKAKTAQVMFTLQANHRLCLTGTPMENHLGELWSMFHFLMPGYLGNHDRFTRLFRSPIEKSADMHRLKQLQKRLQPFMLRRTKDAVATELPAKTEIIRTIPLSGSQRDLYETVRLAMDKKVQLEIGKKGLARSHIIVLDALLKLRQTCCDPRLLSLDIAKHTTESAKLEMLLEMLTEMLEEGRKVLIFSQFVKMLKIIEQELISRDISYTKLTGQTRKRDEAINSFQDGEVDVFLISLKAGGVGLNLTAADTVIHYDPWWNPAAERQATDRAHRIGQDKPVFVYKLLTEETVEEKILALQQKKQALADAIYAGKTGENSQKSPTFTQDELMSLLEPLD